MILPYCAIVFQVITFWDAEPIKFSLKDNTPHAVILTKDLSYTDAKYGLEVKTWGVSMAKCEDIPAEDHLKYISYFVDMDGNGGGCR